MNSLPKMSPLQRPLFLLPIVIGLALTACVPATKPAPPPSPAELARQAAETAASEALARGISYYQSGSYKHAEDTLLSAAIWNPDSRAKVESLKYLAFTYCVTKRPASCRMAFERALGLDPGFQLSASERSHPLWGPQFQAALGSHPE